MVSGVRSSGGVSRGDAVTVCGLLVRRRSRGEWWQTPSMANGGGAITPDPTLSPVRRRSRGFSWRSIDRQRGTVHGGSGYDARPWAKRENSQERTGAKPLLTGCADDQLLECRGRRMRKARRSESPPTDGLPRGAVSVRRTGREPCESSGSRLAGDGSRSPCREWCCGCASGAVRSPEPP